MSKNHFAINRHEGTNTITKRGCTDSYVHPLFQPENSISCLFTHWELDNRHAPEYVLRLLEYYIRHENLYKEREGNNSNIIMYTTEDGLTKIEVTFDGDTVWLSLDQMAKLFQRDKSTISRHIKNIFSEGELRQEATVAKFATVQTEGNRSVSRDIEYYNLDVIISVGYRVKSLRGTQFRIWASSILKEYMKKGFALDDERLKRLGGGNYFDELLSPVEQHFIESIRELETLE